MTVPQIQAAFATLAQSTIGIPAATFLTGYANDDLNENARISWKFSCSRYSTGTPNFHVNGLPVTADASWTLTQWQQLLDPLFGRAPRPAKLAGHS